MNLLLPQVTGSEQLLLLKPFSLSLYFIYQPVYVNRIN